MIALLTTTPTIMMIPMNEITLKVFAVTKRAQTTPIKPKGTENMIKKGWSNEPNWDARTI